MLFVSPLAYVVYVAYNLSLISASMPPLAVVLLLQVLAAQWCTLTLLLLAAL
jgi:hypothetical protein